MHIPYIRINTFLGGIVFTLIIIMAMVMISILVGLNFSVGYNKTEAKVVSFVFGAFSLPVIVGSIFALVLIDPNMDMPRFIVGCLLISGLAIGMVAGGVYLAEKAEHGCARCKSVKWPLGGRNAGLCWSCSDLLDEEMEALHYHCGECRNMHDPCGSCWELIDKGQHPQQNK